MYWTINRKVWEFSLLVILFVLAAYFILHTIRGERGIGAWGEASETRRLLAGELAMLEQEKASLEKKISLLGDRIDPDLLEMQVRRLLGYVHPREVLVLTPALKARFTE